MSAAQTEGIETVAAHATTTSRRKLQVPAAGAKGRQRTLFLIDSDAAAKVPPQIGRQGPH